MKYTIKTAGLMCGHCDASVETKLLEVPGVTEADADHTVNVVTVECTDGVAPDALKAAIEAASDKFSVLSVEVA